MRCAAGYMAEKTILSLHDISKIFPLRLAFWQKLLGVTPRGITALDKVSFSVPEGSIVGVIGESGCGKTTLAKVLTRLENADSGEVYYKHEDRNLLALTSSEFQKFRRRIQMIFQNPYGALNPRLSTFQTLKEPLEIYKKGTGIEEQAIHILNMVGLTADYLHRYPHEMSGGQRQRVNIARALTVDPEILIADEPVSALDVSTQINILNLLKEIQQKNNIALLLITHDLGIAKYICDRIIVMYLGEVVEWSDKDTFFKKPLHPYSEMLIESVPRFEDKNSGKAGALPKKIKPDKGCLFAPRCPYVISACREKRPPLKDGFPKVRFIRHL